MLATTYPLLDVFFTMLWFVGFMLWIWLVIAVFADIFRSHDMSGWIKALWVVGVVCLPLLGVLIYLIARGGSMQRRAISDAQARQVEMDQYIRSVAKPDGAGTADELAKLAKLRETGAISQEEFDQAKAHVLHAA